MPSSLQASIWPCSSASRENNEYSICSEASGCTTLPRLSDSAEHSESEMKRVLPSLTSSAIPSTLSSTGTFGSTRDMQKTSRVSMPRFFKLCSQVWQITRIAAAHRVGAAIAWAAALRMNDHIISAAADRFADQAMIVALAIASRCVEKIDVEIE